MNTNYQKGIVQVVEKHVSIKSKDKTSCDVTFVSSE